MKSPSSPSSSRSSSSSSRHYRISLLQTPERRPLRVLHLRVTLTPAIVDRHFRFDQAEQTFLKRVVRLPVGRGGGIGGYGHVACDDDSVIAEVRRPLNVVVDAAFESERGERAATMIEDVGAQLEVFFKVACAPAPRIMQFHLAIYAGGESVIEIGGGGGGGRNGIIPLEPLQIWSIHIHCLQRVDLSPLQGQSSLASLGLVKNLFNSSKELAIFSSSPDDVVAATPQIAEPFVLPPGGAQEVTLRLRPLKTGRKTVRINVIERGGVAVGGFGVGDTTLSHSSIASPESRSLFRAWLVCLDVQPAVVTKAFELRIPVAAIGDPSPALAGTQTDNTNNNNKRNKCVHYTNPYAVVKTFSFSSDRPDLLAFREDRMRFSAGETRVVGLHFSAAPNRVRAAHLVSIFVNDETDKNEETFAVRVMYT